MIDLETLREKLGASEPWKESRGAFWLNPTPLGVRRVAMAMSEVGARFITITTYQLSGTDGFRLEYHWDLEGRLLGLPFTIAGNTIDSIFDLCESADWIEREIHEEYSIDFSGREYEPLLLRQGDASGVNLREEAKPKPAPLAQAPTQEVAQ